MILSWAICMLSKTRWIPWRPLKLTAGDALNFLVSLIKKHRSSQCSLFCWMISEDVCAVWCVLQLNRSIERKSVNGTFLVTGWDFLPVSKCTISHWKPTLPQESLTFQLEWTSCHVWLGTASACGPFLWATIKLKIFNRHRPCSHLPHWKL